MLINHVLINHVLINHVLINHVLINHVTTLTGFGGKYCELCDGVKCDGQCVTQDGESHSCQVKSLDAMRFYKIGTLLRDIGFVGFVIMGTFRRMET